jgi:phage portal protein BeeE
MAGADLPAVYGIPAIVAGLGAGLDRSTFANFKEARESAYESFLVPMWRTITQQLTHKLLPAFGEDPNLVRFHFDTSEVRALGENENERHERIRADYEKGLIKLNEARVQLGFNYDDDPGGWKRDNHYSNKPLRWGR